MMEIFAQSKEKFPRAGIIPSLQKNLALRWSKPQVCGREGTPPIRGRKEMLHQLKVKLNDPKCPFSL